MARSTNLPRGFSAEPYYMDYKVADNVHIYQGAAIGLSAGYARPLVAADKFVGFAEHEVDNTVVGHAAGGLSVRVRQVGVVHAALSGVAITDCEKIVYMSDDETFTLTAGSNSLVGKLMTISEVSGYCFVRFNCQITPAAV